MAKHQTKYQLDLGKSEKGPLENSLLSITCHHEIENRTYRKKDVNFHILLRKAENHKVEFSKDRIQKPEISKGRKVYTHFSVIFLHLDYNWAI